MRTSNWQNEVESLLVVVFFSGIGLSAFALGVSVYLGIRDFSEALYLYLQAVGIASVIIVGVSFAIPASIGSLKASIRFAKFLRSVPDRIINRLADKIAERVR